MKISDKLKDLPLKKLSEIQDLQGNLKDLSEKNFEKLKNSIEENGFKFPFYVWFDKKNICWTLDGHQRKRVITNVYGDVEVPYIEVEAKDKKDAKKQILLISSQYGQVTKDGFDEFSFDLEKEFIDDFTTFDKWNDIDIDEEEKSEELNNNYTQKIKSPVYEVKNEKPEISQLYNIEKTNKIIAEIENSSCDKEIKQFLIFAAQRHIVFNYELIADFYAHSDKETQNLMENSALIIIDINKDIEHGYIKLSEEIKEQYLNDYPDEDNE